MGYFPTGYLPAGYLAPGYLPGGEGVTPPVDATYEAIYAIVASLLGKPTTFYTPTPDALLVVVTAMQVPIWLRRMPCITNGTYLYGDIAANDLPLFNNGVALIIADILRGGLLANSNEGQGAVVEEEIGPDRTKYATPLAGNGQAASETAVSAAWEQFSLIPCVSASRPMKGYSMSGVGVTPRACGCSRKVRWY